MIQSFKRSFFVVFASSISLFNYLTPLHANAFARFILPPVCDVSSTTLSFSLYQLFYTLHSHFTTCLLPWVITHLTPPIHLVYTCTSPHLHQLLHSSSSVVPLISIKCYTHVIPHLHLSYTQTSIFHSHFYLSETLPATNLSLIFPLILCWHLFYTLTYTHPTPILLSHLHSP